MGKIQKVHKNCISERNPYNEKNNFLAMKTPEKKVSEMTGRELASSIAKGIVGGIFALLGIIYG